MATLQLVRNDAARDPLPTAAAGGQQHPSAKILHDAAFGPIIRLRAQPLFVLKIMVEEAVKLCQRHLGLSLKASTLQANAALMQTCVYSSSSSSPAEVLWEGGVSSFAGFRQPQSTKYSSGR